MKHRRRVDILAAVLAAAGNGARKTRIMQQANLSYELLKKYLGKAVGDELIRSDGLWFQLTEKGRKFLEQYNNLYEEYTKVGNNLKSLMSKWEALEHTCQSCFDDDSKMNTRDEEIDFERKSSKSSES